MKFPDVVVIALLSLQFNIAKGFNPKKCGRGTLHRNPRCDNIYIWNDAMQDFLSLMNHSITNTIAKDKELANITIRVIADNMMPYIISSNYSDILSGYLGDIWTIIEQSLKFKSKITSVGYDKGLEIITKSGADIMLAAAVEKKGLLNVEFSQPYFYNWYHLFLKKPQAVASSSSYLRTLDEDLWIAALALLATLTILLWITMRILTKYSIDDHSISLSTSFLAVCGGFLNQGNDANIICYSGRIQLIIALLFGLLLYSAMNAVLVAQLAIFELKLPFQSLEEIAQKRTHTLCVRTNSFVYNNFTDLNRTLLPEWKGIVNGPRCPDINLQENVAKIICAEGIIVLESRVVISAVQKQYNLPCEITFLKTKLFVKSNHFIFLKNFKYKKNINKYVKKLGNAGIMERLENQWVTEQVHAERDSILDPQVTIYHVLGILNILFCSSLVSLVTLAIEMIYKKYILNNDVHQYTN